MHCYRILTNRHSKGYRHVWFTAKICPSNGVNHLPRNTEITQLDIALLVNQNI